MLVIAVWCISAAILFLAGFGFWVMVVLGLLWLAAGIVSLFMGHTAFGSGTNTDLMIVIAGAGITAAILIPQYTDRQPCNQPKKTLRRLAAAEHEYFAKHKAYTTDIKLLNLQPVPQLQVTIARADKDSFVASASHLACDDNNDGKPDVFTWDSANGGLR